MTNSTPYNDIGPFKGVPEHWRSLAAARANRAYERARDIALRSALEVGDSSTGQVAVRESLAAVNAAWRKKEDFNYGSYYLGDFGFELFRSLLLASVPGGFATILGIAAWGGDEKAVVPALVFAGIAVLLFVGVYFESVSRPLRNYRDFKTRGYAYDDLPDAIMGSAGNVWLLADKVIVLAFADDKGYNRRRVVFYDAIGSATVEARRGIHGVTLTSRDGCFLGRIDMPEGPGIDGAEALVEAIKTKISPSTITA